MREMALDTLRDVTYICPIYSVRSNLTVMTASQKEYTQHRGSCRRKGRLHDHRCRPRPDRQVVDRAKERARKGPRKSEGYALSSFVDINLRPAALARVLDVACTSSTSPPSVPSAERHAKNLNHLDAARISLAKALNDADSSVTSKQAELTLLKEELRELGESD